ncbi:hypothetical protein COCCADRAFT_25939 [Bipolaris zeicola 26-R-13]|uniref:Secreted protein n=1 Tax=Cochliobolus carbonum (strain 26-R-13) TaxID=930089 RepID=W6Y2B8_COCC2|nr:uncharacterized protein COCCADRAFT_25939 [Bipolaris zeicola 26-R-13]EUC33867.1 hypothetical protein COCCADRAFT_25939 [Bipolaris zeicola 26-R-13]
MLSFLMLFISPTLIAGSLMCCFSDVNKSKKGPCNKDQYARHRDIINGWMQGCIRESCGTQAIGSGNPYAEAFNCPKRPVEGSFGRVVGDCYIQCIGYSSFGVCPSSPGTCAA